jgi:hypothetical protein
MWWAEVPSRFREVVDVVPDVGVDVDVDVDFDGDGVVNVDLVSSRSTLPMPSTSRPTSTSTSTGSVQMPSTSRKPWLQALERAAQLGVAELGRKPQGSLHTMSSGQRETSGGGSPACSCDPETPGNRLLWGFGACRGGMQPTCLTVPQAWRGLGTE